MLRDFKKFTAIAVICASVFMYASASESASSAFVEACKSYSRGDWSDAKFMLKKAVSYKENLNPDTYYMLIMAEVYDGDNRSALDDCNFYLENFSDSMYYSRVYYQKGKLLYSLGEYEKSMNDLDVAIKLGMNPEECKPLQDKLVKKFGMNM